MFAVPIRSRAPLVLLAVAACGAAPGQAAPGAPPPSAPPDAAADAPSLDEVTVVDDATIPALVAVGVDGGFPNYQTVSLRASLQVWHVGVAARVGWGPRSGVYVGGTLRGYPPIPGSPVPLWIGGGLGATSAGATPFAAVGAHVPVAPRWRIDLEAGAAFPELLDDRVVAPHLAVGVSYAWSVSLDATPAAPDAAPSDDPAVRYTDAACEPTLPDASRLRAALNDTVDEFVDDLRATYGSLYSGLGYSVRVRDREVEGDSARLEVRWSGSARDIASGERVSGSGDAEVSFRWNGCDWRRTGLSY